jgi:eukaryotic-like serine/threonine-protein kinase
LEGVTLSASILPQSETPRQPVGIDAILRSVMPEAVGAYRLLRCIGCDASGSVYHAQAVDGRDVTLTTLHPRMTSDEADLIRFYQQARLAIQLSHTNLVKGLEISQDGGMHFFVREFLAAETLQSRIQREGAMPEAEAVRIIRAVADAVEHLHKIGIVHRGLTPNSILIASDGRVKVAGLTSAKRVRKRHELPGRPPKLQAQQYMSPQQICDRFNDDMRSDIYALGAILFKMLTGTTPFDGQSKQETLVRKYRHEFAPPKTSIPELSHGIVAIIRECLSAAPERRPQDIARFRRMLDNATEWPREYKNSEPISRWQTAPIHRGRSAYRSAWGAGDLSSPTR